MKVHLVCNAHLDPAWLWELEEGAAEAVATFRIAADFCDEFDGFVFNHNEAILYQWIKEYDPALFSRIQDLVRKGKWHVMGGWFLQPDCNMPSGESFVRQILVGRSFFSKYFGVEPTTALNFDPFGHTRGLVQILAKAGYTSYIHCRPSAQWQTLPADYYRWVGYDGSSVMVARKPEGYNSRGGQAVEKIESVMERERDYDTILVLWGIGNHGGGPSRRDLEGISDLLLSTTDNDIKHSTPEAFFADLAAREDSLPEWSADLNPWAPGCYTSQIRIKQKHRLLENMLFSTERMAAHAALAGLADYPATELADAQYDLLTAQFHDILPGSSIRPVEEASLRLLDHGLEILSRVRTKVFFRMASRLPAPEDGSIPIIAYNSLASEADGMWECEFQPSDQNWSPTFTDYEVYHDGLRVPSQVEHEASSITLDWRKKVVFHAKLPSSALTKFTCVPKIRQNRPSPEIIPVDGRLIVEGEHIKVVINTATGLIDELFCDGTAMVEKEAFCPIVVADYEDPWGSTVRSYREKVGQFSLMDDKKGSLFSGLTDTVLPSVRVIEDGPVRTVIEALVAYNQSSCILRYKIPKRGYSFDLDVEVHWQEKNRMLKLAIPTLFSDGALHGQVAYGTEVLPANGDEVVTQRWQAVINKSTDMALAVVDDGVYGSDYSDGELRISLLHGPVYSALAIGERPLVSPDRHHPRIDQGERSFRFRLLTGDREQVLTNIDSAAQQFNEPPYFLSLFTRGNDDSIPGGIAVDNPSVVCSALKMVETGNGYVLRLYNSLPETSKGTASLPAAMLEIAFELGPYEVATYVFTEDGKWWETDLLERS